MQIFRTVVGNNDPQLTITCERNGTAIDISGATVTLAIRNERTGETTNTGSQSCSISNGPNGIITYAPQASDFPTEDRYLGDVKIVYVTGRVERIRELLLIIARPAIS